MSDKLYDFLNKFQRWLPALGVFYVALASIWGLPYGDQINKTIGALAAFIAPTLEIASDSYYRSKASAAENDSIDLTDIEDISIVEGEDIDN